MPDHRTDLRHRRRAGWAKLALTVAVVVIGGYLLVGLVVGAFDEALQGLR